MVQVFDTRIEPVTPAHQTPWLTQWTLHTIRVPEALAVDVAEVLSRTLDGDHPASWYADFKDDTHHYIVFRGRTFLIDRRDAGQYAEAVRYGIEHGLPEHQADFVALIQL
jgi:hypothetical protein